MLGDRQKQDVKSKGVALQAGNDIQVNIETSMSVDDIEKICLILFKANFPVLQDKIQEQALKNATDLAEKLESKFIDKAKDLIIDKFNDPDVQATLCDALKESARKGDKLDNDVLSELIIERVLDSSDFANVVLSEAVQVLPKLTKEQICHLSFTFIVFILKFDRNAQFSEIEHYYKEFFNVVSPGLNLTKTQKQHLSYAGVGDIDSPKFYDIDRSWGDYYGKYPFLKSINNEAPTLHNMLEHALNENNKDGEYLTLTSVGKAIAITHLNAAIPELKLDLSNWIK